jgi:hypothetical protein
VTDKVQANSEGQAAGRDLSNSTQHIGGSVGIIGDGATGNVIIQMHVSPPARRRTTPPPIIPEGSISEAQAARLKELIGEWVNTHNQIKKRDLTHQSAWLKLNGRIKVATYRATPASKFAEQEAWLLKQAAILRSMASAPAKDDSWRTDRIRQIKTRASKNLGNADIYKPYIKKNFGASSLTELANDELQKTYNYVFSKKKAVE